MLINKLKEIQKENMWTQNEMANHLGVSRTLIALTLAGKRKASLKLYKAVLNNIPSLESTILNELRSEDD